MNTAVEGAIYEVALSLEDAAQQQAFLELTFRDDPQALQRMKTLLGAASEATSFFLEAREARTHLATQLMSDLPPQKASPTTAAADRPPEVGSCIGDYLLVRCLGEGGSGIVYEAEQAQPVRRRVALKLFWIDTGSAITKARFDVERQALAIMDHPNIAKVLDVGGFHNGSPYFVLELVEGESITSYCDREKLDVRQRIALFIDVCEAIQHAHSKRIIHRDIKPSNVLVSGPRHQPVAKVIDFGIAKAVATDTKVEPRLTGHDHFLGTPAYMSPEQVEMIGIDVDTRSDVYSLGVLLYELLTSQTPFDRKILMSAGMAGMRKLILDKQHLKPSARLTEVGEEELKTIATARQAEPARLLASVRGDLDGIVMKALEKDRNSRYETASALALDLKRHLQDKPVTARRPNNFYTFTRFVRRNRIPFYSALAGITAILLGFGASTMLYLREKEALSEQERLSLEAQKSRDQELALRQQAQARANVSRAAFLLGEGKISEAEELLQQTPLVSIEPSKEASSVFRTLGNWYATYGKWAEAVQCYRLMAQATQMTRPEEVLRGTDLLITAPALLELGDRGAYDAFRTETLSRYLPVTDSLQAEHILKACLIVKTSPEMLQQMADAAAICEAAVKGHYEGSFPAWEAYSLALYSYRKGEYEKVLETGQAALAAPNIREICAAGLRAMMAMSHLKLGHEEAAKSELKLAKSVIRRTRVDEVSEEKVIFFKWYDWSVASLLLREAEASVRAQTRGRKSSS